jgi:sugar phosphate permease
VSLPPASRSVPLGYRWVVLAIGAGAQGVYAALLVAVPVLAPALRTQYHLSLRGIGTLLAAAVGGQVLTQYGWGVLNDRFGERLVLPLGLGAAGAALALAAASTRFAVVVAALVFAGMSATSVSAASGRAIMGWFATGERGIALGIRQTAVPLGSAAAAIALPLALDTGGLRSAFLVLVVACVVTSAIAAVALREPPFLAADAEGAGADPLRDRRLWRLIGGSMLLIFVQGSFLGFTVLFLHGERGMSTAGAAGVLAAVNIAGGALRLYLGFRSDRRGRRIEPLCRISLAIAVAAAVAAAAVGASNLVLVPLLFVAGALATSWNGLLVTATAELAGRARTGAALGVQQTALALSVTAAGPAFAALVTTTSWQTGFAILAVLPLGAYRVLRSLADGERRDARPNDLAITTTTEEKAWR